jgi:hypothetical protein
VRAAKGSPHVDGGLLAGWLFADLLLALFVVFLGAQGGAALGALPKDSGSSTGGASATPTSTTTTEVATTTTTAPPPAKPAGVETTPYKFEVQTNEAALTGPDGPAKDAERQRIADEVITKLRADGRIDRRAGFVLTFGVNPTVGQGQVLAAAFNETLKMKVTSVFGSAALRNFDYRSSAGQGQARVEVYFLTN